MNIADRGPPDIRTVTLDDYDVWLPLWSAYQTFYKVDIPLHVTETTWARFHDGSEPMWAALAWRDTGAVGLVHWIFHRSCWTVGDYCYLQDLFVKPNVRGGGVGRGLIEHVYAKASEAHCSRVVWLTQESNHQAMGLYDQVADKTNFLQYRKVI